MFFCYVECDNNRHKTKRKKMSIPQFDERGLLPAGVHTCTLDELKAWAASVPNAERRLMLVEKFENFLNEVIRPIAAGWPLVIDGSFATDKPFPNDIDFALDLRECKNMEVIGKAVVSIISNHEKNRLVYLVDGYPNLPGNNNFEEFFGYVGQKTGSLKNLSSTERKGTLRIEQW